MKALLLCTWGALLATFVASTRASTQTVIALQLAFVLTAALAGIVGIVGTAILWARRGTRPVPRWVMVGYLLLALVPTTFVAYASTLDLAFGHS